MPKASEIKKNTALHYDGKTYIVSDIERSVPQGRAGGSLYRMRMYDVVTGSKIDETFKDSDMLNLADLVRKALEREIGDTVWPLSHMLHQARVALDRLVESLLAET